MRPPAPTKIECKHGQPLVSGTVWAASLCICCGNDHRSPGHLCLSCRPTLSDVKKKAAQHG